MNVAVLEVTGPLVRVSKGNEQQTAQQVVVDIHPLSLLPLVLCLLDFVTRLQNTAILYFTSVPHTQTHENISSRLISVRLNEYARAQELDILAHHIYKTKKTHTHTHKQRA